MIQIKYATVAVRNGAVWSSFEDGTVSANWVPQDEGSFARIAFECGFVDPGHYLLAHEVTHHLVPEVCFDRPSYVVHMAAQNRKQNLAAAMAEERLVYFVQRAAAGAIPIIDDQWHAVIARLDALGLAGDPATAHGDRDFPVTPVLSSTGFSGQFPTALS